MLNNKDSIGGRLKEKKQTNKTNPPDKLQDRIFFSLLTFLKNQSIKMIKFLTNIRGCQFSTDLII